MMLEFAIFYAALFGPVVLMLAGILVWRFAFDRDRRRSPVNFKVLKLPGEGLRERIDKHTEAMGDTAMVAMVAGPTAVALWGFMRLQHLPGGLEVRPGDAVLALIALVAVAWAGWGFVRHARARRKCRQGLEAELATAQNLLPLLAEGCIVFHDFPADGFNIDHVVVAPNAVFAIETKSRRKPRTGGKAAARVKYDGRGLTFPTHRETQPVEQAKMQAEWLRRFLTSAVGESVAVVPVLALPGWYVEREGDRSQVVVTNLRNATFLLKLGGPHPNVERQRRIVHALTERYPAADA